MYYFACALCAAEREREREREGAEKESIGLSKQRTISILIEKLGDY